MKMICTALFILAILAFAWAMSPDSSFINLSASYTGDLAGNVSGGIRTGHTYMGMMDLMMEMDFEAANLWKGGLLYVQFENTHGGELTSRYVGDLQTVSNLENGNFSYLYELWYKQSFSKFWFKIGKIDMNVDFLASDPAGEFINSSFGIMPTASSLPVCIFPKNSTALCGGINISENMSCNIGIFDGNPLDLEEDPYSLDFRVDSEGGVLIIGELQYTFNNVLFRAGGYHHTAEFMELSEQSSKSGKNWGVYTINDIVINDNFGMFFSAGIQPGRINEIDKYIGAGGTCTFSEQLLGGVAFATAFVSPYLRDLQPDLTTHETAIELFINYAPWEFLRIQPELQYIINPGVAGAENSLVALARTSLEF